MVGQDETSARLRRVLVRSQRQHLLLGQFGKCARERLSFEDLALDAARIAAEGTSLPLSMVLAHSAEHRSLRLQAAIGWQIGLTDGLELPADGHSSAAMALANGTPLEIPDLDGAQGLGIAAHQRANGIRRVLGTSVNAVHGPVGVIEVSDIRSGAFDKSDRAFLEGLALLLGLAHDRDAERAGRSHLAEEQRSLMRDRGREIASIHREVKNSLQLIHALLVIQANEVTDAAARAVLEDSAQRVITIGSVHEQLAQNPDVTLVDMRAYITGLLDALVETLRGRFPAADKLQLEADDAIWPPSRAHMLGMVLTELMLHLRKFNPTTLRVVFRQIDEHGRARLVLERDGESEPDQAEPGSLSLRLVRELLRDADAQLIQEAGSLSRITVLFPAPPDPDPAAAQA